jgi:hypothetical protein
MGGKIVKAVKALPTWIRVESKDESVFIRASMIAKVYMTDDCAETIHFGMNSGRDNSYYEYRNADLAKTAFHRIMHELGYTSADLE